MIEEDAMKSVLIRGTSRQVMAAFSLLVLSCIAGRGGFDAFAAEAYPNKPLSYVVFFPPGGKSDLVARIVAPYMQKYLGTSVVVLNEGAGAGVIGHKVMREAKPDGYMIGQSGATVTAQYTKPGISIRDYTWIGRLYMTPYVVAVPVSSSFKTVRELVEYSKANPKRLNHGSIPGATPHLASVSFQTLAGIEYAQIAYKGEGPTIIALASKEVDLSFGTIVAMKQMIDAGKIRLLAVSGGERLKGEFANLPTFKESGYDFDWGTWEALLGPKELQDNKEALAKLTTAVQKITADPEFIAKMKSIGFDSSFLAGREFDRWMADLDRKTREAFNAAGLKMEN
jgi:tripartite-type tricarboxylate transporter receptor subunit TctC